MDVGLYITEAKKVSCATGAKSRRLQCWFDGDSLKCTCLADLVPRDWDTLGNRACQKTSEAA